MLNMNISWDLFSETIGRYRLYVYVSNEEPSEEQHVGSHSALLLPWNSDNRSPGRRT